MNLNFFRTPLKEIIGQLIRHAGYSWIDVEEISSQVQINWGILDCRNSYLLFVCFADGNKLITSYNLGVYHNYGIEGVLAGRIGG